MKITCAACKTVVELPEKVGFRDTCSSCDAYLHSCKNCSLYVKGHCTESSAEKVGDPEGMNFCEWFTARTQDTARSTQEKETTGKAAAEEMWKRLTKK